MKKQTRSQARDAAFTQVFQMNMHEDDMDVILEELLNARPECETNLGYIRQIIDGVKEHESELEDTVAKYLKAGWTLSRISKAFKMSSFSTFPIWLPSFPIIFNANKSLDSLTFLCE